ncbi:putative Fimh-like protein [Moraxella macacae 0408225]|uniref:Putative Fimh-like protein n=1 Tax=Moraxella macacae 0408225 TaxID=1230338 RepID=L2F851_9GAMM|nr:DUF1566 domain-containing protein [Moraxella macacae]ELA09217.1 putative Fimh-like protein [Moraxella macacae 0408225]
MKNLTKKATVGLLALTSLVAVASQITTTIGVSETPTADFTLSNDSVTDTKTGLVWQRCVVGQSFDGTKCTGTPTEFTSFEKALANNKDGWRLPTIKELSSLSDHSVAQPALNLNVHKFSEGLDLVKNSDLALWSATPKSTPKSSWGQPTYKSYVYKLNNGEPTTTDRSTGKSYKVEAKYVLLVKN